DNDLRGGTTDGGDQDLIASFKPHVSVDLSGMPMVLPGNTAHRPLHPTRFPTVSPHCGHCVVLVPLPQRGGKLSFAPLRAEACQSGYRRCHDLPTSLCAARAAVGLRAVSGS